MFLFLLCMSFLIIDYTYHQSKCTYGDIPKSYLFKSPYVQAKLLPYQTLRPSILFPNNHLPYLTSLLEYSFHIYNEPTAKLRAKIQITGLSYSRPVSSTHRLVLVRQCRNKKKQQTDKKTTHTQKQIPNQPIRTTTITKNRLLKHSVCLLAMNCVLILDNFW